MPLGQPQAQAPAPTQPSIGPAQGINAFLPPSVQAWLQGAETGPSAAVATLLQSMANNLGQEALSAGPGALLGAAVPKGAGVFQRLRALMRGAAPQTPDDLRLLRAVQQGRVTPAVHGTRDLQAGGEFIAFRPNAHFGTPAAALDRLVQVGDVAGKTSLSDPAYTMLSGAMPNTRMIPVLLRGAERYAHLTDAGANFNDTMVKELLDNGYIDLKFLREKLLGGLYVDDAAVLDRFNSWNEVPSWLRERVLQRSHLPGYGELTRILREEAGIPGIAYINEAENPGSVSYLVFDPKDIRSVFANFDPAKQDIADLLATLAAVSVVGSAAAQERNKDTPGQPR